MFKKESRIKKDELSVIYKKGKTIFTKRLGLKFIKNDLNKNRYTVVVGNKVSKKAVERNQIKKRIRNIVKNKETLFLNSYDIIILTLPLIKNCSFVELNKEIEFVFKKAKFIS